jgi:hypothetical protein
MTATPPIQVRQPRAHDIVDDPIVVAGVGTGFEGTLPARVRDHQGRELVQKHFMTGGTGIWGNFLVRLDVPDIPANPHGTLEVYEISAKDGSEINKRVVRIVFGRSLTDPYQGFAIHVVQSGDTLSGIAEQYYGDPDRYPRIFQANRHVLEDPDVIVPGQELRIPM